MPVSQKNIQSSREFYYPALIVTSLAILMGVIALIGNFSIDTPDLLSSNIGHNPQHPVVRFVIRTGAALIIWTTLLLFNALIRIIIARILDIETPSPAKLLIFNTWGLIPIAIISVIISASKTILLSIWSHTETQNLLFLYVLQMFFSLTALGLEALVFYHKLDRLKLGPKRRNIILSIAPYAIIILIISALFALLAIFNIVISS